jgi:beta-galactosidase
MNIECDFVHPASENLEDYKLLVVPALYTASDSLLKRLNKFVKNGVISCIPLKVGLLMKMLK